MPIEFKCVNCGKSLQTPDGTGGRQAQCPECNTMMDIPNPAPQAGHASSSPSGYGGQDVGAPGFGGQGMSGAASGYPQINTGGMSPNTGYPQAGPSFGAGPGYNNPYQPSQHAGTPVGGYPVGGGYYPVDPKSKVVGPAIGMIVGASLSGLIALMYFGIFTMMVFVGIDEREEEMVGVALVFMLVCLVPLIANIIVVTGAISMMRLRRRGLAMTACVLGVIPGLVSLCWPVAIPFAIWGLVAMSNPEVKAAFSKR